MKTIKKFLKTIFSIEEEETKTEKCVLCGADTGIPVTTPIDDREDYIQGCGQLCASCRRKIHRGSPYIE